MSRVAVFPGSFDPMTNGAPGRGPPGGRALRSAGDRRAAQPEEGAAVQRRGAGGDDPESVAEFGDERGGGGVRRADGRVRAPPGGGFIVRGLRAVSDFEAELQMAHTNRSLQRGVDTVFLMSALEFGYLSSTPGQGSGAVRRRDGRDGAGAGAPRAGGSLPRLTGVSGRRRAGYKPGYNRVVSGGSQPRTSSSSSSGSESRGRQRQEAAPHQQRRDRPGRRAGADRPAACGGPAEVPRRKRITEEATRITERAREEGDAVIARAQEQAARCSRSASWCDGQAARGRDHRHRQPGGGRDPSGGDEYAAGVLIRLEGECIKALTSIKRGIDMLDERYRSPRSAPTTATAAARASRRRRPGSATGS